MSTNTFTLRLTGDEAEALERLAVINGQSKNTYITSLLIKEYQEVDPNCQVIDGELISTIADYLFPGEIINTYENEHGQYADDETLLKAYRAYKHFMASDNYNIVSDDIKEKVKNEFSLITLRLIED